jgi:hypothetical protein
VYRTTAPLQIALAECGLERREVGTDHGRIQSQGLLPQKQPRCARLSPLGIEQLVQHVAGTSGFRFGPETCLELIPTYPALMGHGEKSEDRQPTPLGDGAGQILLSPRKGEPPKRAQPQHQLTPC